MEIIWKTGFESGYGRSWVQVLVLQNLSRSSFLRHLGVSEFNDMAAIKGLGDL